MKKPVKAFLFIFFSINALSFAQTKTDTIDFDRPEADIFFERYAQYDRRKALCSTLENSEHYRAYIRQKLLEEDLPPFLEFLPVIESNYKPTAKPANGTSMGIWQFMPNSIAGYLELDEWIDQRRDPWLSTDAALKKLKANYQMFNDWPLALAAYNCGAGAVKRALEKSPDKTYWDICQKKLIPDHAINYVPNFLAVCRMVYNGTSLGYEDVESAAYLSIPQESSSLYFNFDYLTVTDSINLERLALELRVDADTIRNLNLSLIKGITPPDRNYTLRLPSGMAESAWYAIMDINKNALILK
ncbi:MAG: lytic transglycosylase domain-containing protein [Treponema sp.]|nr:lytic transglycosylase domain-containing protein [Treponema sp.]